MKKVLVLFLWLSSSFILFANVVREEILLDKNWKFSKGDFPEANQPSFSDKNWESVVIPHDWAIKGPFDRSIDLQETAIVEDGETSAVVHTGRTGGLPYTGIGWYRKLFDVPNYDKSKRVSILFDGAMSNAEVYINGKKVGFWPNGYNSFHFDITDFLNDDGQGNLLAVRLENLPQSARWYPGAGLYRNVHLIVTNNVHVPVWGTYITTPFVSEEYASVNLRLQLNNIKSGDTIRVKTEIIDTEGNIVAQKDNSQRLNHGMAFVQNFTVKHPKLWSPETPHLYKAMSQIYHKNVLVDEYATTLGIRDIKYIADKGFFLNGKHRKFQGVCNHHDLGPLGAAVNEAALRRQLMLLKDMGCNAIRTSHNMPAPELVHLCDEIGFMMMVEAFDEWAIAKCDNGYHRYFDKWAEKDMVNMLHHYRNHPSVVMWSIGNEVREQCTSDGYKTAAFLQDICHREDPTRPVTCGMNRATCTLENGFAALLDIPGFNYGTRRYPTIYQKMPQGMVLGSETASTVSSRGVYKFPVKEKANALYDDLQCSSYDVEACGWSNIPDKDFALAEDYEWAIGQFVWTGFDYLGEPTPYKVEWPNHSSMFGIIDLASIPKDRYYLYRSLWNRSDKTLHILPHWTWDGREGEITPVFVYTNYHSVELFINGKSYGKQSKNSSSLKNRFRLMWMDVIYEPGELKAVAYDEKGNIAEEKIVRTAGKPYKIELTADRTQLAADGKDLAYITVKVTDKNGNLCPHDRRLIKFSVKGNGSYRASANGDPTSLDLFHLPQMHVFNGMLTTIVQAGEAAGKLTLEAKAFGIKSGKLEVTTK